MISVWNQLHVSRANFVKFGSTLFVVAAILVVASGITYAQPKRPVVKPPVLVFNSDNPQKANDLDLIERDQKWLSGLAPASWQHWPSLTAATSDSTMAALKSLLLATSATDTLARSRPITSRLRDRWLARGYLATKVSFAGLLGDTLVVDTGPVFTLASIEVTGKDFPDRQHLFDVWLPQLGEVFKAEEFNPAIDRLLLGAGEVGFPFARWTISEISTDPAEATVSISAALLPGYQSVVGPITSDLPAGRSAEFLVQSSGLRSGQLFQHSALSQAQTRLLTRDLYASVDDPVVYMTGSVDTVGVHFPVVMRRKVNSFQVVLGLSRSADDQKSRLSGEVDLRLPNLAGTGRSLHVQWSDDGRDKAHLGFKYLEPLAFGTPLDTDFLLDNEIQQDSYTRIRLENRWRLQVVNLWGVEVGGGWDRSTFPTGTLERTRRVRARGAFLHRRGDRSISGWAGSFAVETGWRSNYLRSTSEEPENLDVASKLGELTVERIYEVDLSGELWLNKAWSLAGRTSYRELSGAGDDVPLSERFRFGGAASLRGYREDEFSGSKAAWGSLELRIGRPGSSRLYTFYDLGYFLYSALDPTIEDPQRRSLKEGWPRGYGLGILARTPAGDISLAIGFPGTVDFDQAKLHVTLLESF